MNRDGCSIRETERPMGVALSCAEQSFESGEVPVGCVVTDSAGCIISMAGNAMVAQKDPTAHAEMIALRQAALIRGEARLFDCDIYTTLEPCTMCAAAISLFRIRRVYFGASDEKGGAVENGVRFFQSASCFHVPEIYGGIGAKRARELLEIFFSRRR